MATSCESKLSMKLLIDTKAERVLFAEADSNCVDFLFHILSLPVGTVIRLLKDKDMNCCLPNLYQSIENLKDNYIQPNQNKDILLNPKYSSSFAGISSVPFLLTDNVTPTETSFYKCSYYHCSNSLTHVTDDPNVLCPSCRNSMSTKVTYVGTNGVKESSVAATSAKGGFVKELVTYMVLDDLVVKPMSTISSITLLNKFNVRDVSLLQEEEVNFGMEEALELLKASFESKRTILTKVFMKAEK